MSNDPRMMKQIVRIGQPDPDYAIVYVEFRDGIPDAVLASNVRALTKAVHDLSTRGQATVVAQVGGITVCEGEYNVWDGSIRVKMTR